MNHLRIFLLSISFILFACNAFSQTGTSKEYTSLDESEELIINTIIEEFRSDHYEFLGEKSTTQKLFLAVAVPFDPDKDPSHEESEDHVHGENEQLNVVMVRATDEDVKLNNNLIKTIGPYKLTYKELYTVGLHNKKIIFEVSTDDDNVPGRKSGVPDQKIIERIASRLKGTIQGNTINLP
jgi:hypothetical protein